MDVGRRSKIAKEWALSVKKRDGFKCQHCGLTERDKLQSHHIVPWEKSSELRFEISNGLTLCKFCHSREDRRISDFKIGEWSKGRKKTTEQIEKMRLAKIGSVPWNKSLKGVQVSTRKGTKQKPLSKEQKAKIGNFTRGRSWRINNDTGKREWYDKQ